MKYGTEHEPKKITSQVVVIVVIAIALVGAVVIGLASLRRQASNPSPHAAVKGEGTIENAVLILAPTLEQTKARENLVALCRERLARAQELGRHLEAPVLKTAPIEKWSFDSADGREAFENAQSAVAAYVHALVTNTEALHESAEASPTTTYGRKVLEARRLQHEVAKLDLQIFNERKRSGLSQN